MFDISSEIILYSNDCPKCKVLKKKLKEKGIEYDEPKLPINKMIDLGISSVPVLYIDGEFLEFAEANEWIKQQEEH